MEKNMVFYHPLPLSEQARSASGIRPLKMLQAFQELGYSVDLAVGYVKERKLAISKINDHIKAGKYYDFCYGESSTMPTLLTEPHHLPLSPLLDFNFLKSLKQNNIPTGIFYRDIFWKFAYYRKKINFCKGLVAKLFYQYELSRYPDIYNILFLPEHGMAKLLPEIANKMQVHDLPPGCEVQLLPISTNEPVKTLKLFYVGGITPPVYDISPLFDVARNLVGKIEVVIACRQEEWEKNKHYYNYQTVSNLKVVHTSGEHINQLYAEADIFAILWHPFEYLDFAAPYKLYEAMGNHKPILTLQGTRTAEVVHQERIGWAVKDVTQAISLLEEIRHNRDQLLILRQHIAMVAQHHTWQSRAMKVSKLLGALRREI